MHFWITARSPSTAACHCLQPQGPQSGPLIIQPPVDLRLGNATQVGRCGTAGLLPARVWGIAPWQQGCIIAACGPPRSSWRSTRARAVILWVFSTDNWPSRFPALPSPHQIHYTWGPKLKSRSNDTIMWAFEKRLWRDQRYVDEVGHVWSTSHGTACQHDMVPAAAPADLACCPALPCPRLPLLSVPAAPPDEPDLRSPQ